MLLLYSRVPDISCRIVDMNIESSTMNLGLSTDLESADTHHVASKDDDFQCGECSEHFKNIVQFQTHVQCHLEDLRLATRAEQNMIVKVENGFHSFELIDSDALVANNAKPTPNIQCAKCSERFADRCSFDLHTKTHAKGDRIDCKICSTEFPTATHLRKHIRVTGHMPLTRPRTRGNNACHDCGKVFTRATALTNHLQTHLEGNHYECSSCERAFKTKRSLDSHNRERHSGMPDNECQLCSKVFSRPLTLKYHMERHARTEEFECDVCGKRMSAHVYLLRHKRKYHLAGSAVQAELVWCKQCSKSFTAANFQKHVLSKSHLSNFSGQCPVCQKTYSRSADLERHTQRCAQLGPTPYTCGACGEMFSNVGQLAFHAAKHAATAGGGRQLTCTKCGGSFGRPGELKTHVATHMATHVATHVATS